VKRLSCGVNLDVLKILNAHVYVWWSLLCAYVLWWKDWLTCEEGLAVHVYNAKRGGDVDGVFWYK
jgi:hypothetical protein